MTGLWISHYHNRIVNGTLDIFDYNTGEIGLLVQEEKFKVLYLASRWDWWSEL